MEQVDWHPIRLSNKEIRDWKLLIVWPLVCGRASMAAMAFSRT